MAVKTKPAVKSYIHEKRDDQHRLVLFRNGVPSASKWFENREIGEYDGLHFHVGAAGQGIPSVFRATAITHEVL